MRLRSLIAATMLVGAGGLIASPGLAQAPQRALPDLAIPRASLLPQAPAKTAAPRPTTTEEAPAPPVQSFVAPPRRAPIAK
jgi:hypothetical protein